MKEIEFNLIDEPWIRVLQPDGAAQELSLEQTLLRAHEFSDLGGEMPSQNAALLRLLLAVLHTVFYRVDAHGAPYAVSEDAVEELWRTLWERGSLPQEPIREYLAAHHEEFWLFHPQRPFGQVPQLTKESAFSAAKLIGELSQGGHKARLFASRRGSGQESLDYAEAARWLLHLNAYDDSAVKKGVTARGAGLQFEAPGTGWLGKLGLLYAQGDNLFQTLLLNLVLENDDGGCWGKPQPYWEKLPDAEERRKIIPPDNQAALLSLPSRLLLLQRDAGAVCGFHELSGTWFPPENAFVEQMTVWRQDKKSSEQGSFRPIRNNPERQIWRDYGSRFVQHDGERLPGVINWLCRLQKNKLLPKRSLTVRTVAVQYDSKGCSITDASGDVLTFRSNLLTQSGRLLQTRIEREVAKCDALAREARDFAKKLCKAAGGNAEKLSQEADVQLFARLDEPFRCWLEEQDPDCAPEQLEQSVQSWQQTAQTIARALGRDLVEQAGPTAFAGRTIAEKRGSTTVPVHYAAPLAYNQYLFGIRRIYQS